MIHVIIRISYIIYCIIKLKFGVRGYFWALSVLATDHVHWSHPARSTPPYSLFHSSSERLRDPLVLLFISCYRYREGGGGGGGRAGVWEKRDIFC